MGDDSKRTGVNGTSSDWRVHLMLWPLTAARIALNMWDLQPASPMPAPAGPQKSPAPGWTSPNTVALELRSMRLRDFSSGPVGHPTLVCAPFALHAATIADFAPGHSIVEALQRGGVGRLHVTDWRSASPEMRYLAIDDYLADLNVAVDSIGAPVDLVGLCQGGWLSLVYAARFPAKVRKLVLVGAPVDVAVRSDLARMVTQLPSAAFEQLVAQGAGLVKGEHLLALWSQHLSANEAADLLQCPPDAPDRTGLLARFAQWNDTTVDLPGSYYLQVVNWIFRENRIAEGRFDALGRTIRLKDAAMPVFLLAGIHDEVVPLEQALATARLIGTPVNLIERASEPCRHLGLFIGAQTLANSWTRIAGWLAAS